MASGIGWPSCTTARTASQIGSSTPSLRAMSVTVTALTTPSTTAGRPASRASAVSPRPRPSPKEKLRDCSLEQVSVRSPSPARPLTVSRAPPRASARRLISARPRVISAARVLAPKPTPWAMPQAMAMTFFTAPPTSTPTGSWLT